jgi:hypothetical protein
MQGMEGEHDGELGHTVVRAGSLNVMQEIGVRIQMEYIVLTKVESARALARLILSSEYEDLGNAVRSLQLGTQEDMRLSNKFWSSVHCVALTTRRLRDLNVPNIDDPVPASLLAIVAQISETTLTSLNIWLDDDTELGLVYTNRFINMQRLRIQFNHYASYIFNFPRPFSLPAVHDCTFVWNMMDSPALLQWISKCRFQEDCKLRLQPETLSVAESEELSPLFESHRSELVSISASVAGCEISPASTIFQRTQRIDFGRDVFPSAEIFSAARLPRDVWFIFDAWTRHFDQLSKIADDVLSSGCTHDLRIHVRGRRMDEQEFKVFLTDLEMLSEQLRAQGVVFIGVIDE